MDKYCSFCELAQRERTGIDYRIEENRCQSDILIMAPHGGNIEFGTSEIARDVAGKEYCYYGFIGLRVEKLRELHLTSHNFDEPRALEKIRQVQTVLTIHGFKGDSRVIYLGGLDKFFKYCIAKSLHKKGFLVRRSIKYKGCHLNNVCNRGKKKMGVQLEISSGLRNILFKDIWTFEGRKHKSPLYYNLIEALRQGIDDFNNNHLTKKREH